MSDIIADSDGLMRALAAVLVADVAELDARGVVVWHHGQGDPTEDIEEGVGRCGGVALLITDDGGEETIGEGDAPILEHQIHMELYVDATQRGKMRPGMRYGGQIRDAVMRAVHCNPALRPYQHCMMDLRVVRFMKVSDPDYAVWRIVLARTFPLEVAE